ncbi:MAG: DegT/DnrJ/EryC1/StrS family aminotransferase [Phycisphaeraceae bacterium]|nr:DegT/DnrJ/EryC1/StrS family aminotransferase [Phycisphaeraceae bacterium]
MTHIPLSHPDITESEIQAVVDVLRSGRLSIGPRQSRFEELVADRAQRRYGVAVSSGTAGLHMVLQALGIGPGDEVITTPFSFIATANCILYVGAKPVFVDIDPRSLNMDPAKVEAAITRKTKAIIAVEVFGDPTHMDKLVQIAGAHEIPLVEDCCEGLGGTYKGRPIGSFGRVGVFGFYPNKQITTGEGGMIVTDDDQLANACRSLRNQGRPSGDPYDPNSTINTNTAGAWLYHERLGYNYRLSEIAAALGIAQMERLSAMLDARRHVAAMYMNRLMDWEDLILPNIHEDEQRSWFVFVIRLSDIYGQTERDRIITGMRRHEVGCSNYFPCIHLQPFYRAQFGYDKGDFPVAESVSQRTLALPFFNRMDETRVELTVHTLKVMVQREQLLKKPAPGSSAGQHSDTPPASR